MLEDLNYSIIAQIVNYNDSVIGLYVRYQNENIYVPSLVSSIDFLEQFIFLDQVEYVDYNKTKVLLQNI